jgi:hypothetical protein
MEDKMRYWMTGCSLAAAQLIGACAADSALPDDAAPRSPPSDEQPEIAQLKQSLHMDHCDDDQINKLFAASVGAYYAMQWTIDTFDDVERRNRYFGVGHNEERLAINLSQMWYINLTYKPTTFICAGSHPHCVNGFPPAFVESSDVEAGIEKIFFCDSAFNTNVFCDDPTTCIASLTGIMLHEIAHLAGVVSNPDPVTWQNVQNELAQFPEEWRPLMTTKIAEIYHYWILNRPI